MAGQKLLNLLFFLVLAVQLAWPVQALAGDDYLHLSPDRDEYFLGPYLDLLLDSEGLLTIQDLMKPQVQDRFKPNNSNFISLPTVHKVVWLRFQLLIDADFPRYRDLWFLDLGLYSGMDKVDFYSPDPDSEEGYQVKHTLAAEVLTSEHYSRTLSFIIMDIDNFKRLNDTYGHPEGDKVLKKMGDTISANIRGRDCASRYGGEEFTITLPDTTIENGWNIAERIRKGFASQTFTPKSGPEFTAGISIGQARRQPGEDSLNLIERADKALYMAKRQGKNRVVAAP